MASIFGLCACGHNKIEQSSGTKTLLTSEATHHLMSLPESWPVFHNKRKDVFIPKYIRPGKKFHEPQFHPPEKLSRCGTIST